MTAVERAVLLSVRSTLAYELQRYEASVAYWSTGDGAGKTNADKNIRYNASRIDAIKTSIEQINLLVSE